MKNLYRLLPLLVCLLLALPALSPASLAYESGQTPAPIDADSSEDDGSSAHTGMSPEAASLGKVLLSGVWSLFGVYVPGFGFTFGQMWLAVALASVSILVVKLIFGFSGGPRGLGSRTSSTRAPKISKERRHDEF